VSVLNRGQLNELAKFTMRGADSELLAQDYDVQPEEIEHIISDYGLDGSKMPDHKRRAMWSEHEIEAIRELLKHGYTYKMIDAVFSCKPGTINSLEKEGITYNISEYGRASKERDVKIEPFDFSTCFSGEYGKNEKIEKLERRIEKLEEKIEKSSYY
jgi:hypothetical protein